MKKIRVYTTKKLIDGERIGLIGQYVAIPDRGFKDAKIIVKYLGVQMTIPNWHKAEMFRRFHDQFNRDSTYTLGYFKFVADEQKPKYIFEDGVAKEV